jgi:hypothetical protein
MTDTVATAVGFSIADIQGRNKRKKDFNRAVVAKFMSEGGDHCSVKRHLIARPLSMF